MYRYTVILLLTLFSCSGQQIYSENTTDLAIQELQKIVDSDITTPEQKQAAKFGMSELKNKKITDKKNAKLTDRVISQASKAGAGNLSYAVLLLIGLGMVVFIVRKIIRV